MGKCDVCGKEAEVQVVCSTCGAISFAYCPECLNQGREPYDALVGMGLPSKFLNKTYKAQILMPSLQFHGKTIEEFDADVQKLDEEYEEWLKRSDANDELESELELC